MPNPLDSLELLGGSDKSLTSFRATLAAIMKEFKGPEGFAREFKRDFDAAAVGSPHRLRSGTAILSNLEKLDSDDDGGDPRSLEEKRQELKELLQKLSDEIPPDDEDDDGE